MLLASMNRQRITGRRADAWWEPSYDPSLEGAFETSDWNFSGSTGPKNAFLEATNFGASVKQGSVRKFENLTFEKCDFQGEFEHEPAISFKKCRFHFCDFAYSVWIKATFTQCEFVNCSFALATFEECEFRDCKWERIGLQGSKTDFYRTFLNNPTEFIKAGFSGLNPSKNGDLEHRSTQAFRLELSKAQVARTLLSNHREVGDSDTYYESARLQIFKK